MSASAVRMGRAFVEIGADPAKLFRALNEASARIGKFGSQLRSVGTRMMGVGTAMLAPIAAASVAGTRFDDVLRNMQASTGVTAQQMDEVRAASMAMSQALGIGPTEAANGFLELLKAGMQLEDVLNGAGKAAIEFARVGKMDVSEAAVVMADAMNVFGVSGRVAANTLSAAADASSTDIQGIALAFSQVSAVASLANQSILDTAAALAVLANNGIKGSDAGTSVKTMLLRLMAPAEDAAEALREIGLSINSFRNADGTMKSLVDIIGTLNTAMAGMGEAARDDIFRRIFGTDAIRAAAILTTTGVDGFNAMREAMGTALPVSEKFAMMMGGLTGVAMRLFAAIERLGIVLLDALGPSLAQAGALLTGFINGLVTFVTHNQAAVVTVLQAIAAFAAVGVAIYAVGAAINTVASVTAVMVNMWVLLPTLVGAAIASLLYFGGILNGISQIFSETLGAMYEAMVAGDLSGAMEVLWLGLQAAWLQGVANFLGVFEPFFAMVLNTFTYAGTAVVVAWESMWSVLAKVTNTVGAILFGIFDNIVNQIMSLWDTLVAAIQKSWNYVKSFFTKGYDLKAENEKVDSEMAARARQRELERPGIEGRMAQADAKNRELDRQTAARADAMNRAADEQAAERNQGSMGKSYQDAADAARQRQAERTAGLQQAGRNAQPAGNETDIDELARKIRNNASAAGELAAASDSSMPAGDGSGITAGGASGAPTAEAVGTFSAFAVGGMGTSTQMTSMEQLLARIAKSSEQLAEEGELAIIA